MSQPSFLLFGFAEEQHEFASKFDKFIEKLDSLHEACAIASTNVEIKPESVVQDRIIFSLGQMIMEDMEEVVVLCSNGLATGAMKILRGMFERTVHLAYLDEHPEEAEQFLKYHWVDRKKALDRISREYPGKVSEQGAEEVLAQFEQVKESFQVPTCDVCPNPDCQQCKKPRLNWKWSKKDIISMAKEVNTPFAMVEYGYYKAMEETHPKISAIFRRLDVSKDEVFRFAGRKQAGDIKTALGMAHYMLLATLNVLQKHFNIEPLIKQLPRCLEDFNEVWSDKLLRS